MKRRVLVLTPLLLACGPFFYQAPPPLEAYPQRIPGKDWRELFNETNPLPADSMSSLQLIDACKALVEELPKLPQAERLAKADALLTRNREGDFNYRVANFLHELRELAADEPALAAAEPYLGWRLEQPRLGCGAVGRAPVRLWSQTEEQFQQVLDKYQQALAKPIQWFQEAEANAIPEMLPYLLVQRAAFDFEGSRFPEAVERFDDIIQRFPDHPRAEVARFMKGRCHLAAVNAAKWRDDAETEEGKQKIADHLQQANDGFHAYLEKHPQGRFAPDANGWLAAVAVGQGNYPQAITRQIERLSLQPSRETTRSVLRECDRLFTGLFQAPATIDDADPTAYEMAWDEMVKHPEVMRLFVFHAMDPVAHEGGPSLDRNLGGDRDTLDFLHRRLIRPLPFAKDALQALGEAVLRSSGIREPDALALGVLGWSSLRNDDGRQALALFDRALAVKGSDELLHGRALALSSLGRHGEASAAYQELARDFPGSPLVVDTAFEAAIARFHAGEAGEALLALLVMSQPDADGGVALYAMHPEYFGVQWIDSIAQFAPIDQLAAPLKRLPPDDRNARLLRAIVRGRALSEENFALARRHLDAAAAAESDGRIDYEPDLEGLPRGISLTAAIWRKEVESLAGATDMLDEVPKSQRARRHLQIGRGWKALRGRLTMPLHHLFDYARTEPEKLDQLRRKNATLLGLAPEAVVAELDSRDELHHALRHFLIAAESKDPDVAAPALEEANEALLRLAEFSHYRCSRAVETDASGLSRKLVERLRRDFPNRPETARAAIFEFVPVALLGPWMPGDYRPVASGELIAEAILDPKATRWADGPQEEPVEVPEDESAAATDLEGVRQELARSKERFDALRSKLSEEQILHGADVLDDLLSVANAPDMTFERYRSYLSLRGERGFLPEDNAPGLSPLAPWLEFRELVRMARREDGSEVPLPGMADSWKRYMDRYPDGPKAEPASFRRLRIMVRAAVPIPKIQAFHFPDAPIPNGYKRPTPPPKAAPETLRQLAKELDEHEKRFPKERYHADVGILRAAVSAQLGDHETAVKRLTEVVADPSHPELRMFAALYFSEIALRLLDKNERAGVAAAFRAEPAALPYLKNLVHGDTCLFRLRPLMAWLERAE
jgi:outer membrane protein assembly factor BamD (BamD/ComL family)